MTRSAGELGRELFPSGLFTAVAGVPARALPTGVVCSHGDDGAISEASPRMMSRAERLIPGSAPARPASKSLLLIFVALLLFMEPIDPNSFPLSP
jgi:hypothetical protein